MSCLATVVSEGLRAWEKALADDWFSRRKAPEQRAIPSIARVRRRFVRARSRAGTIFPAGMVMRAAPVGRAFARGSRAHDPAPHRGRLWQDSTVRLRRRSDLPRLPAR